MPQLPHQSSTDFLVLHSLRCLGFVSAARIVTATGLSGSTVEDELLGLGATGHVAYEPGDFGGWGLTENGRTADAEWTTEELAVSGTRAAVTLAYEDFLVLNPELLDLCTAWQLQQDIRVLDLLMEFDQRADTVLTALAAALLRFRRYRVRLTDALTRARSGQHAYVTDDLEAYHTVWFQLHEDLLATLGIPR